jgi:hypothetical protein
MQTILILIGSAILTHAIPFSSFFRNLDTMIHEFGHALVTLLLSGQVLRMELHADHSGVTYSSMTSTWSAVPIALAGYISSALFAMLMFYLRSKRQQRLGLKLITAVAIATRILFVHSGFGAYWLIGFIVLNVLILYLGETVLNFYYLLLAFLTLEEAVSSSLILTMLAAVQPGAAGDATGLRDSTGIPALAWSILFLAISLMCAKAALGYFFKQRKVKEWG